MTGFYCHPNARTPAQAAEMRQLDAAGICVFCALSERSPGVLHATATWLVAPNPYPYEGADLHALLIPRHHATDLDELPAEHWATLPDVLRWMRRTLDVPAYGLAVRTGNPFRTGATITHVHWHAVTARPGRTVRVKLAQEG